MESEFKNKKFTKVIKTPVVNRKELSTSLKPQIEREILQGTCLCFSSLQPLSFLYRFLVLPVHSPTANNLFLGSGGPQFQFDRMFKSSLLK